MHCLELNRSLRLEYFLYEWTSIWVLYSRFQNMESLSLEERLRSCRYRSTRISLFMGKWNRTENKREPSRWPKPEEANPFCMEFVGGRPEDDCDGVSIESRRQRWNRGFLGEAEMNSLILNIISFLTSCESKTQKHRVSDSTNYKSINLRTILSFSFSFAFGFSFRSHFFWWWVLYFWQNIIQKCSSKFMKIVFWKRKPQMKSFEKLS